MTDKSFNTLLAAAVLGLIVGAWGMFERLIYGLNPVAFGSYVPWGLWVAFYLFFLGLSAGAILVTSMTYVFGMKRFERIARLSAFTVLVCLVCEALFITLDLGRMSRIYRFLLTPSFTSLMTWMMVLFTAMLIVYALETFFLIRGDLVLLAGESRGKTRGFYRFLAMGRTTYSEDNRASDEKRVRVVSILSLPMGILFYGMNGAFFAVVMNRPLWNSTLTPIFFIVAAILSGGALITFLTYIFLRDDELVTSLGRTVLFALVFYLFLELVRFFVAYQSGLGSTLRSFDLIATGPYAWTFWLIHLAIGSLAPLLILIGRPMAPKAVALACFLIVITFVTTRYDFVVPALAGYAMGGLDLAFQHPRLSTNYTPNLMEWLVSIWIISLGLLAFLLGTRWLPVISSRRGGMEHAE